MCMKVCGQFRFQASVICNITEDEFIENYKQKINETLRKREKLPPTHENYQLYISGTKHFPLQSS